MMTYSFNQLAWHKSSFCSRRQKDTTDLERLLQETDLLELKYDAMIGGWNTVF
jgi:hypothetical protein